MSAAIEDGPHQTPPEDQERPRKRIRKGTRSCWECMYPSKDACLRRLVDEDCSTELTKRQVNIARSVVILYLMATAAVGNA